MTNPSPAIAATAPDASAAALATPRRRRRRGQSARGEVVRCRLAADVYSAADRRAARAGLAVAAWLALLGLDVALHRPVLRGEQLEELRTGRDRLRLIGATVNSMAAAENRGRPIPDAQLAAALARVHTATAYACQQLADVRRVFADADRPPYRPRRASIGGQLAEVPGGRRQPAPGGARRDRVVFTRLTVRERDVLVGAAVAEGLAVGGWLGQVAEAPEADRPALLGEQYAAVERVRRAARQLRTNLGQIADARASRHAPALPELASNIEGVDELIRRALHVRGLVAAAGRTGE